MGKTSFCIQMLEILYSRDVVSIGELASLLKTNKRNIPEYRKELEVCGYLIETVPGRYGGYRLNKSVLFPTVKLNDDEKDGLMQGFAYLRARDDFMHRDAFAAAMAKISAAVVHRDVEDTVKISKSVTLTMTQEELEARYLLLQSAIRKKNIVRISYRSLDGVETVRSFHPYRLFIHDDKWYALGFDELDRDIRYFKLNRILEIHQTDQPFRKLYTYHERDYLDEFGMKHFGDWFAIKLKLDGVFAQMAMEKQYGKNQTIESDKDGVILSCEMQNRDRILQFVLGCGEHCTVLEPEWLKNELLASVNRISKKY